MQSKSPGCGQERLLAYESTAGIADLHLTGVSLRRIRGGQTSTSSFVF